MIYLIKFYLSSCFVLQLSQTYPGINAGQVLLHMTLAVSEPLQEVVIESLPCRVSSSHTFSVNSSKYTPHVGLLVKYTLLI